MSSQDQVSDLLERIGEDGDFVTALDADPLAALRDNGFADLADAAERERDRLAQLVDRIYEDAELREAFERDPAATLEEWDLPELTVEQLLVTAGAPDELVARVGVDVEAHLFGRKPASAAAVVAVLGTLAFAQQATAASNPAASVQVSNPAVSTVQVSNPAVSAQVSNPALSRVAARTQVNPAQKAQWRGIQVLPAHARAMLLASLRSSSSTL